MTGPYWTVPREYTGEPVFIIAGGPSVLTQPLELLRNRRVIVINSSYEKCPWADVLFFADSGWWRDNEDNLKDFAGKIVTTTNVLRSDKFHKLRNSWNRWTPNKSITLSHNPSAIPMRYTSLASAANYAFLWTGGPQVWLGADGRLGEDGRSHHYDKPPRNWAYKPARWKIHFEDLKQITHGLTANGISVYNASPGTAWPDLAPVMDLKEALQRL